LSLIDRESIIYILTDRATDPLLGLTPQQFFQQLVLAANLPRQWVGDFAGAWSPRASANAIMLVDSALGRGVNRADPRFETLGSVLYALLQQVLPLEQERTIVAVLLAYRLVLDGKLNDDISLRYRVPLPAAGASIEYGPNFKWRGPEGDVEFQGFFSPPLPWDDVGFLQRALVSSASVCRIELDNMFATGFLVGPARVLTNYHVLKLTASDDFEANARRAVLRFGCLTSVMGDATKGLEFRLAPELVLERSPTEELDFALLKVEDKIRAEQVITPAPFAADLPTQKSPLNILHHPGGDTMKLSRSSNGVSGVYADRGLVQYVTPAMEGSSGSPCFNDEWKVVALHHAQRSRAWGSVREGILIRSIEKRIQPHLQ
jgi:V8-like Glu-specific endopeptidase